MVMNKEKLKASILEWMFVNNNSYSSAKEWRKAFVTFLNEEIDKSYEGLMFEQVDDIYDQLRKGKGNYMGIPFECEDCGAVWDLSKGYGPCPICKRKQI